MFSFVAAHQTDPAITKKSQRGKWRRILLFLAILLVILIAAGGVLFCKYLDNALFQEHSTYFVDISRKAAKIIGAEANQYRNQASTAERLLLDSNMQEDLSSELEDIRSYLALDRGLVLAFDSNAQFYTSDGASRYLAEANMLRNQLTQQAFACDLDYQAESRPCILFLESLDHPVEAEGHILTHIGLAVDTSVFQEISNIDIFRGESHVYVVDRNGRRIFQHICDDPFIDHTNLLTALSICPFTHGDTLDGLRFNLSRGTSGGYEFSYGRMPYFVAASPVPGTQWSIMSFISTEILETEVHSFLGTSIIWFIVIVVLIILLVLLLAVLGMDRRHIRQAAKHQQAVDKLREDADIAKAASLAKSDFLTHMSRDIRVPISEILCMADIVLQDPDNPEIAQECLRQVRDVCGKLLSMVTDMVNMAKFERDKPSCSHEPLDLREVLAYCANVTEGQLQSRNIQLVQDFQTLSHPQVFGDEARLRQVLINLLSNVMKCTSDNGKIYFRAKEINPGNGTARFRLEVEGTGMGIKLKHPEQSESFVHGETDNTSGLGMAVTRQFVDMMGGTISVESRPNQGSCFIVELPLEVDQSQQPASEDDPFTLSPLWGTRLLMAEDNALNAEIVQCILEEEGIEVVTAENGQKAVDAFCANPPGSFDWILMDMMMPVMDGLEATQTIRALPRDDAKSIPIIAVTVNAYQEDARRCLEAGMNSHISKPVDRNSLTQTLSLYIKPMRSRQHRRPLLFGYEGE